MTTNKQRVKWFVPADCPQVSSCWQWTKVEDVRRYGSMEHLVIFKWYVYSVRRSQQGLCHPEWTLWNQWFSGGHCQIAWRVLTQQWTSKLVHTSWNEAETGISGARMLSVAWHPVTCWTGRTRYQVCRVVLLFKLVLLNLHFVYHCYLINMLLLMCGPCHMLCSCEAGGRCLARSIVLIMPTCSSCHWHYRCLMFFSSLVLSVPA